MDPHNDITAMLSHAPLVCHWEDFKPNWREGLLQGNYDLAPLVIFYTESGWIGRWCVTDALVIKALCLHLQQGLCGKFNQSKMREKVLRLYQRGASNQRIEVTLTHWMRWVKAGLGEWIQPSLESLTLTIHNSQFTIHSIHLYLSV